MITLDEAKEILANEYHIDNFTYLIKELLLPDFVGEKHDVSFSSEIFTTVKQLGDSVACNLSVFEVVLKTAHKTAVSLLRRKCLKSCVVCV